MVVIKKITYNGMNLDVEVDNNEISYISIENDLPLIPEDLSKEDLQNISKLINLK